MSKQITKAILDSVVSKAINAAMSKGQTPKRKKRVNSNSKRNSSNNNNSNNAYVASSVATRNMEPKFIRSTSSSCRIQHEELCFNLPGSGNFTVQKTFRLNPGLSGTFPWLSSQARSWERYRFISLSFKYKTRAGTSTIGSVIFAPDYDPSDAAPFSETIMSTYQGYKEDAPWKNQVIPLSRSELSKVRYVRTGDKHSDMSIADYDIGNLFAATSGFSTSGDVCGKVYVEYDIELSIPLLDNDAAMEPATILLNNGGNHLAAATPFGVNGDRTVPSSSVIFTVDTKNLIIKNLIPGVRYFLSIQFDGTGFGTLVPVVYTHVTSYYASTDALTGTTQYHIQCWFTPTDDNTTITLSVDFAATTVTFVMISIAQADLETQEG